MVLAVAVAGVLPAGWTVPARAADPAPAPSDSVPSPVPPTESAPPSEPAPVLPAESAAPPAPPAAVSPPPAPIGLPAGVTPLPASVTFQGRGYGHGVGLSQYGARGRALAGQAAPEILAHYFRGTTPGLLDPATPIRVQLLGAWRASRSAPLTVHGRGGEWSVDGVPAILPPDAKLTLTPTVSRTAGGTRVRWGLRVTTRDGTVLHEGAQAASFVVRPAAATTSLQLAAKPAPRNRYRGVLRIIPHGKAATVAVANDLELDIYLRGVVPVEMPPSWPTEALRAQAVVARSYAARALRPGASWYDVFDDTRSQVYHGLSGERAAGNAAIAATAGQVLRAGSAIANTLFHSTAGGHTEHNENVFVSSTGARVAGPVGYLRGVADLAPDGTPYDAGAPFARWSSATWTPAQLSAFLRSDARTNVGSVLGLDLRVRGVSGRLLRVTIHGTAGTKRVSADVFRAVINRRKAPAAGSIRSNLFELALPAPQS